VQHAVMNFVNMCDSLFICWLILNIIFIVYKVFAFELKRLNTKDASTSTIVYSRKQILQQHLPIIVL
jgi:hypothetical protein